MLEYYRFKAVLDLFLKGREDEAKEELTALQRRYVSLCDENLALKMQVQEYEDILYLARNLHFDGELYWLVTGSIRQGPFCPKCWNRDGMLVRLAGEPGARRCSQCLEGFRGDDRPVPMPISASAVVGGRVSVDAYASSAFEERKAKVIPFQR